jgi:hypothetical protein
MSEGTAVEIRATESRAVPAQDGGYRDEPDVHYWSEKWGVSDDAVRQAIRKVGPMVKDVARELGRA